MNKNDDRFQLPQIEDICTNIPYAFTISPSQTKTSRDMRKDIWKLSEQIAQVCYGFTLEVFFEYSSTGRLHGHGFIVFTDVSKWIFGMQGLQVLGAICIKQLFDTADTDTCDNASIAWRRYCQKQRQVMMPIICTKGSTLSYPMLYSEPMNFLP